VHVFIVLLAATILLLPKFLARARYRRTSARLAPQAVST
jgi:hypothetical protein